MRNIRQIRTRTQEKKRTSERADHDDTRAETFGGERDDADLGRDLADALALVRGLAHERHERVRGVRHDGADDTGEVAGRERDAELRRLRVRVLGLREDVRVEHLGDLLEETVCIKSA